MLLDLEMPLTGSCIHYNVLIGGGIYSIPQTYLTFETSFFEKQLAKLVVPNNSLWAMTDLDQRLRVQPCK